MARRSHGCSYTASVDPVDTELITNMAAANNYRIAGNFRGIQFSRFSRLTGKPRKLNPRNKSLNAHFRYSDRPSSKIGSRNLCIQPFRENWIPRKFPAIRYVQTSLKNFPNVVSSYILGKASVEIPYFSFVSTFSRHCWQNERERALAMLWA